MMRFHDDALDEMAGAKSSSKRRINKAILEILTLANAYRSDGGDFSFDMHPEFDEEVDRILIAMSDGLLQDAERRARKLLALLELEEDEIDETIADAESGEHGLQWALDMHASNLKALLGVWIALMFAKDLTVNKTFTHAIAYMNAPEASPLWREAVRARIVDPNEVRFGRGYQRRIPDAVAVLMQTFIYTAFTKGYIRKGGKDGAIGYRTFRQSNYDCAMCDSLTKRVWPIDEAVIPAHPRCVCGIELVFPD